MKVAIINDCLEQAQKNSEILCAAGFDCECFDSFDRALSFILQNNVGFVVTDIFVKANDISFFINAVKNFTNAEKNKIPVVAMSSIPMNKFFEKFSDLDVFEYITIPCSIFELVSIARKTAYYLENF
ncbi:MAG: hypothetical protein QMC67_08500 [Candidatus Wallbacteria bacterium]